MQIINELGWNRTGSNAFVFSDRTKVKKLIKNIFVDAWRKAVNICHKTFFTIKDLSEKKSLPDIPHGKRYTILH